MTPSLFLVHKEKIIHEVSFEQLRLELLELQTFYAKTEYQVAFIGKDDAWHDILNLQGKSLVCKDGYVENFR